MSLMAFKYKNGSTGPGGTVAIVGDIQESDPLCRSRMKPLRSPTSGCFAMLPTTSPQLLIFSGQTYRNPGKENVSTEGVAPSKSQTFGPSSVSRHNTRPESLISNARPIPEGSVAIVPSGRSTT